MNQNRLVQMEQCDNRNISDKGEAGARRVSLAMTGEANQTTTQATAAGHPYTKLQFVYDWQGRRIARHVWQGGTQAAPTFKSSHRWLYDGWNVITEFTASSVTEQLPTRANTFTWGLDLSGSLQGAGGVGGLLALNDQLSTFNYSASYDGNGNIVAWTKSNASAPTSRREYDAFGNTLVSEGAAPSTFGFSTKMQDAETGLYYYGYRFYDPVTGRWPSRDPIGEEGGVNLYGFVTNCPASFVDCLGLEPNLEVHFDGPQQNLQQNQDETDKVAKELESVCGGDCVKKCFGCTEDKCKAEARKIAEAYVKRVNELRKDTPLEPGNTRHFGWKCYEWAVLMRNELKKLQLDCWYVNQVGSFKNQQGGPILVHNYVFVSVGSAKENAGPVKECGKVLDPWMAGHPDVFGTDGSHDWSYMHNPVDDSGFLWMGGKWIPYTFPGPWKESEFHPTPSQTQSN